MTSGIFTAEPIGPTDHVIHMVYRVRVDDEIIHVLAYRPTGPPWAPNPRAPVGLEIVDCIRGAENTVTATHDAGATVEWLIHDAIPE